MFGGLQSADTTNVSMNHPEQSNMQKTSKFGGESLGPVALPRINEKDKSPFRGFIDISLATQKLRKGISTQANGRGFHARNNTTGFNTQTNPLAKSTSTHPFKAAREGTLMSNDDYGVQSGAGEPLSPVQTGMRPASARKQKGVAAMSSKVLETWINETLQDAEHLDIPGVILKPEHKNPISRYGINRIALTQAGIPSETVDRIYRAMFVYSVGFYELIKKCLEHTN